MASDGVSATGSREPLLEGDPALRGVVLAASMGVLAVQLDFFAVQAAVPEMAADLDTDAASLQWVISGYMLSTASFLIVAGRLADIFGRRTWLMIGALIFGGASLLGGAATNAGMLIGMRIVQGAGAAILFPVSLAVVTNAFAESKVQRVIGLVFAIGAIGQALGPVFGGLMTDLVSWRWVLWVNVAVSALVVVLAVARVSNSRDDTVPRVIDWGGLSLVILSIAAFTYGIDRSSDWGWLSAGTLALVGAGVTGLVAFVNVEGRVAHPILDLRLFKIRVFSVMTSAGSVGNMGATIVIFLSMIYLQDVEGLSALEAGAAFLTFSVGYSVAAIASGRMEAVPPWIVMTGALVVGGLATMGMGLASDVGLYLALAFFSGLGFGLCWSYTSVVTQSVVPPELAGVASGTVLTILVSMGGVGLAVAVSYYDGVTVSGAANEGDVIQTALFWMGIIAVAAAPIVALTGRGQRREAA